MRVGVIVEGDAEYVALRLLTPQLRTAVPGLSAVDYVLAKFDPQAPPGAIARACKSRIAVLEAKGADHLVILLDREKRHDCCHAIAVWISNTCRRHWQRGD